MNPSPNPDQTLSQYEGLLVGLSRAEFEFALVGGVAVILNGYARVTQDLAILVAKYPENIQRLLGYLIHWGEGWAREIQPQEFVAQEGSIRISEDFDLDVLTLMRGHAWEDFISRASSFETQGVRIHFLAPADLIELKRHSFRDKDQLDVLALREILHREVAAAAQPPP